MVRHCGIVSLYMEKDKNYAALFGNNPDISLEERNRVISELQKIGGLTFTIHVDEGGWMAQCNEVDGIIAGNTNPNPSNSEIESQIRDAVYVAFNVRMDRKDVASVPSPLRFAYSISPSRVDN